MRELNGTPQRFIDIELLKAYQKADNETKKWLEKIYGEDTFSIYAESDGTRIAACFIKVLEPGVEHSFQYSWNGVHKTVYVLVADENKPSFKTRTGLWEEIVSAFKSRLR